MHESRRLTPAVSATPSKRTKHVRQGLILATAVTLTGVLLLGAWAWAKSRPREVAFAGKPLRAWLVAYYDTRFPGGDPERTKINEEAALAVRTIGTNALPELLKMVTATDSPLAVLAQKQRLVEISFRPAAYWNDVGYEGFKILGPAAKDAVPALACTLEENLSPSSRNAASIALGALGSNAVAAVPALLRATTNVNPGVRVSALNVLGDIRTPHEPILSALLRSLNDLDFVVQMCGMRALSAFGPGAEEAVPALVELTKHAEHHVRSQACAALGKIGSRPETAVPALLNCLADVDAHVRGGAAWSLGLFGTRAYQAAPALRGLLRDQDPGVRAAAQSSLEAIETATPQKPARG